MFEMLVLVFSRELAAAWVNLVDYGWVMPAGLLLCALWLLWERRR